MRRDLIRRRLAPLLLGVAALSMLGLAPAAQAQHRGGHGGPGGHAVVVAPAYRFGYYGPFAPWWGWGFGYGFYGPGPFLPALGPEGGVDRNWARMMGWGAVNLKVKPGKAEVWVDGRFEGKASDLDGYPSYLWLEKGKHRVVVYSGGYVTFEQEYEIEPGALHELRLKMEKGESTLPKQAEPAQPAPKGA